MLKSRKKKEKAQICKSRAENGQQKSGKEKITEGSVRW
jgi:hypothetical protein